VRKQYHFWPGEQGIDAWDVGRLVDLSANLPVQEIPLESIKEIDSDYWFAGSLEKPTVRKIVEHLTLIQEVDLNHPIILGFDGRVMDGMHRIARCLVEGRSSISAVRFLIQPEPDYRNCRPEDLPY